MPAILSVWLLVVFLAALLVSTASAADYYVDRSNANASDENPGSKERPFATISAAVKDLKPGDKVIIKAGEYRETVQFKAGGAADKPITIQAAEGDEGRVVIMGSDPVTDWKHEYGTIWQTEWKHQFDGHFPNNWPDVDEYAKHCEIVFVDGVPLKQVLADGVLLKGTFCVNEKKGVLRIALYDDQPRKNVEVGVRQSGFIASGDFLIVRGLKVMYVANDHASFAMAVGGNDNIIENNQVLWNNLEGMRIGGWRLTVRRNVCNNNGRCGMSGSPQNSLLQDNITNGNSWRYSADWHDGGVKIIGGGPSNNRIIRHIACNNYSKGIWFDSACKNNWVEGCILDNNVVAGLEFEACAAGNNWAVNNICSRTRIRRNGLTEQGTGGGILLYESEGTHIVNNILVGNEGYGIILAGGARGAASGPKAVTKNTVIMNNIFADNGVAAFRYWVWSESLDAIASNQMDYNLFSPSQARRVMVRMDDETREQVWLTLEQWQAQRGQDKHSIAADPGFVNPEGRDFRILPGSPALGAGTPVDKVTVDFAGKVRPQGKTFDIGAYMAVGE